MTKGILLALMTALASPLAQADFTVTCTAKGKATAQTGGGMLYTDAIVKFIADGPAEEGEQMTIYGVQGRIKVASIDNELPLNKDNAYIGAFTFNELRSNAKYRPRKYKNMVQFQNFDAKSTTGLESGMWGNFLIDRSINDGSEAKYIFQAGDHMGGTVHFKCRVQD